MEIAYNGIMYSRCVHIYIYIYEDIPSGAKPQSLKKLLVVT